jgi:hypothetical protein
MSILKGDMIEQDGKRWVCFRVNNCSARFMNLRNRTEVIGISPQTARNIVVERMNPVQLHNFLAPKKAHGHPSAEDQQNGEPESDQMKTTKTKSKSTNVIKPEGKCAAAERMLLLKGPARMTKSAIVFTLLKQFPGSVTKTIKNTVNWCAHFDLPKKGKKSNHLPEPAGEKPAAKKKGPPAKPVKKSKTPPPRPPKAVETDQNPEGEQKQAPAA